MTATPVEHLDDATNPARACPLEAGTRYQVARTVPILDRGEHSFLFAGDTVEVLRSVHDLARLSIRGRREVTVLTRDLDETAADGPADPGTPVNRWVVAFTRPTLTSSATLLARLEAIPGLALHPRARLEAVHHGQSGRPVNAWSWMVLPRHAVTEQTVGSSYRMGQLVGAGLNLRADRNPATGDLDVTPVPLAAMASGTAAQRTAYHAARQTGPKSGPHQRARRWSDCEGCADEAARHAVMWDA